MDLNKTDRNEISTALGLRLEQLLQRQATMPSPANASLIAKILILQRKING